MSENKRLSNNTVNDFKPGDYVVDDKGEEWKVYQVDKEVVYVDSVDGDKYVYFYPHELTHITPPTPTAAR